MSKISARIVVELVPMRGIGSKQANKILIKKIDSIFPEITKDFESQAKRFAHGYNMPNIGVPNQKTQISTEATGELANSISSYVSQRHGYTWTSRIVASAEHASMVEFGTGIYNEKGGRPWKITVHPPKEALHFFWDDKEWFIQSVTVRGQEPKPFMRAAKFWLQDNIKEVVGRHKL